MAHELDRKEDGRAAMIYAPDGGTPWHRLGEPIPEDKRRDLDWALCEAGIDFDVRKVPHEAVVEITPERYGQLIDEDVAREDVRVSDGGRFFRLVRSDDSYSVIRKDRDEVIGTVSSVWTPLQNRDAFRPLSPVLDDGLAEIETGGALRGGKQVWMLVRFDTDAVCRRAYERAKAADGDLEPADYERLVDALHNEVGGGIRPYGLFLNDHTGSAKARVKETAIRVVCANTLDWSLAEDGGVEIEVAHTASVEEDYAAATHRLFGDLVRRYVRLASYREILAMAHLPEGAFTKIVLDRAFPVRHLEEKIRRREGNAQTEAALRKKSRKRSRIRDFWTGAGDGISGERTSWDAYNALTQYLDHDDEAYEGSNRVQSMIDGSLGRSKRRIFRDLLDYSDAEDEDARAAVLRN